MYQNLNDAYWMPTDEKQTALETFFDQAKSIGTSSLAFRLPSTPPILTCLPCAQSGEGFTLWKFASRSSHFSTRTTRESWT